MKKTTNREMGKFFDETADACRSKGEGAVRFCRNGGCELVPDSMLCGICGTNVVREW